MGLRGLESFFWILEDSWSYLMFFFFRLLLSLSLSLPSFGYEGFGEKKLTIKRLMGVSAIFF